MAGLVIQNVTAVYDAPDGGHLMALDPISCTIQRGSFTCLVGPSGCGKSTLIRILAGLQKPTQGQVLLDNAPVLSPMPQVGLMFQEANLMPWRTVVENIALPLELAGVAQAEQRRRVEALLPALELADFAAAYPGELSGGMAQRVALGRVLIQRPAVLLLDEPFGALDAMTREQISVDLLRLWARDRQTVFMVTHNIHEAVLLADRVLVMSRRPGKIIADIPVPLARPRSIEDTYRDEFGVIARRIRAALEL
ncbi:MAG: ABC transporter ATP-binding protein [Anaerolineaceae bacterium]|nr:ABC transporter ATP-binding protein [Anaerolineaceae bacterium]